MKVSLFVSCLTDTFYPRMAIAAVKVLEHLGCTVDFPQKQTCCGQPMYNNGLHDEAATLARRMIDVMRGGDPVVSLSGSCGAMIRAYADDLLANDAKWCDAAKDLAARTYEFSQFFVDVLHVDLRELGVRWPGVVTYHYSCHLRHMGVANQTDRLLEQIEGLEYRPLGNREQCCGFGGTFATKFPQISGAIVAEKVAAIRETGADTVICNEAGCGMNIAGACRRAGCNVQFKSVAEVIAEGLDLLERE